MAARNTAGGRPPASDRILFTIMKAHVIFVFLILCCQAFAQTGCNGGSIVRTYIFGSDQVDRTLGARMDSQGKIVAAGQTGGGSQFTASKFGVTGAFDVWVAFTNVNTATTNMTIMGGTNFEFQLGVGVDSTANDLCLTGYSGSTDFPKVNSQQDGTPLSTADVYAITVDSSTAAPSGVKLSALFGGVADDIGYGVDCNSGMLYMSGATQSPTFSNSGSMLNYTQIFVSIVEISTGTLKYNRLFTSTKYLSSTPYAVKFFKSGNSKMIAITGFTIDTSLPVTSNANKKTLTGGQEVFLMIYNVTVATPSLKYLSYYGGNGNDIARALDVDENGYIYMVGDTSTTNLGCGTHGGGFDAFLTVFHPNGTPVYCKYFGGGATEAGQSVSVQLLADGSHLVLIGVDAASSGLTTVYPFQSTFLGGSSDVYMVALHVAANYSTSKTVFGSYLGTSANDNVRSIQATSSGQIVVSGYTTGSNFPGINRTASGADDGFVTVLNCPAMIAVTPSPTPSPSSTPSVTASPTITPDASSSPTVTPTPTSSATPTPTASASATPSVTPSVTPSPTPSMSITPSPHTSSSSRPKTALIAGIAAAGGVCFLTILGIILIVAIRRRKSKANDTEELHMMRKSTSGGTDPSVAIISDPASGETTYQPIGGKPQDDVKRRASEMLSQRWEIPYKDITIKEELGAGAFGIVYKALWRNSYCVVKQVNVLSDDEKMRNDFLHEINTVKNLRNHPNVCTMLGVCTDPQYPICLVMEFVEGGNLEDLIYKGRITLNRKMIAQFGCDITAGMSHLHHEGVLHCDLACRNLLVLPVGQKYLVKITDFGLAAISRDTVYDESRSLVPIRWSAPEVLGQRKISRAADVWSFGIVMWEILQCMMPYPNMDNQEVIKYVCSEKKVLPKPTQTSYPPEIYEMMLKCWSYKPNDRPTFDELNEFFRNLSEQPNTQVDIPHQQEPTLYGNEELEQNQNTRRANDRSGYENNPIGHQTTYDTEKYQ